MSKVFKTERKLGTALRLVIPAPCEAEAGGPEFEPSLSKSTKPFSKGVRGAADEAQCEFPGLSFLQMVLTEQPDGPCDCKSLTRASPKDHTLLLQ